MILYSILSLVFLLCYYRFPLTYPGNITSIFFINSAPSKRVTLSLPSIVLLVLIPNLQHDQYEMEIIFSATNFSSYIIELLQLQDAIQIQWS